MATERWDEVAEKSGLQCTCCGREMFRNVLLWVKMIAVSPTSTSFGGGRAAQ